MEAPRKFIIALFIVSTKLNKYIVFTMQTYKKLNCLSPTMSQVCLSLGFSQIDSHLIPDVKSGGFSLCTRVSFQAQGKFKWWVK